MSETTVEHQDGVGITTQSVTATAFSQVRRLIRGHWNMTQCPKCGGRDLYRAQSRFYERLRKAFSTSRPYRCHGCRARVWGTLRIDDAARVTDDGADRIEWSHVSLDLTAIDESLRRR